MKNLRLSRIPKEAWLAGLSVVGILLHLVLRYALGSAAPVYLAPLYAVLLIGGPPLVWDILVQIAHREFGSDLLAAIAIISSVFFGQFLAGALVVLMLSGGRTIESFAVGRANSVLAALARRMPSVAHVRSEAGLFDRPLDAVAIGDALVVFPHEICPVDGEVVEGHGVMDESYLTGEPYLMSKAPGSDVLSGAINGESALTIRAVRRAVDSRYAKIMDVMRETEQKRPRMRRLADQLGAMYTPLSLAIALGSWLVSGDPVRFLAVLVVATPCPLLIAIPVAIIGSISLAAKRSIIIKNPAVLEEVDTCRTIILDKTGTLTYGEPDLTDQHLAPGFDRRDVLRLVASLEQYSKHPLAHAIREGARRDRLTLAEAGQISERAGEGLAGVVDGRRLQVTGRAHLLRTEPQAASLLPAAEGGLECVVLVDGRYAATYRFHDSPRAESFSFVQHLQPKHGFERVLLVSGDRDSEVRYLAERVGIHEIHAEQKPEEKVAIVVAETQRAKTLFIGDGINDAPALMAATVGVAFGHNSDITTEAAGAVIMESSIERLDDFFHIGRRLRTIALQSAIGGMALSLVGMAFAATGGLPPVAGAITQELIDLAAIFNALRAAFAPGKLADFRVEGHEGS
ncbi:MAG TPA: heavy metal translocating P-type ATPase [Candidatus Eisenbacteria bacterium]|nr:heavy metal translocating P-type ATPase [Candidatus Eisenbacteria bacterium]